ncbi:capsid [Baminivirus]|uniref:capsid n=1 Tax=Baminivirus TaxID=1229324 RepID=UPI00027EDBC7|nr:capsid [Baminivirus]AFR11827.2 capsid [Baminivirus]
MRYDLEAQRHYRNKWHGRAFSRIRHPIGYRALAGLGGAAVAGLGALYPRAKRVIGRLRGVKVAPNEEWLLGEKEFPQVRAHIKGSTALAKRPLGTLTAYYPVTKHYKTSSSKSMSNGGDTQMADSNATTEAALGWGQHDAKTLYTRRRRTRKNWRKSYRRARTKGSLSYYQKKYIRNKIRARGGVTLPTSLSIINKHTLYRHDGDGGSMLGVDTLGCFFHSIGSTLETASEKHIDIHDIFKQLYAQADLTDATGTSWQTGAATANMRLHIKSARANFTFANNSTQTMLVKMWTFSCKKSITDTDMTAGGLMSLADVVGASPSTLGRYFYDTQFHEQDRGADDDHIDMDKTLVHTFNPNLSVIAKQYLTLDKIQRWEMPAGSVVQFEYNSKIGISVNYHTCLKYFAMKGVSQFFVFQVHSAPYVDGDHAIQPSRGLAADTGVVMTLKKEYRWSPVWNSIDDLSVNQKHKFTPSATVNPAGKPQDATTLEYHL